MNATALATPAIWSRTLPSPRRRYSVDSQRGLDSGRIQRTLEADLVRYQQSIDNSIFLSAEQALAKYKSQLSRLVHAHSEKVEGHDAPTYPCQLDALNVLRALLLLDVHPERIALSADGGVAVIFQPSRSVRAYLEFLNDGEVEFVKYDLSGNLQVHEFPPKSAPWQIARASADFLSSPLVIARAGA